MAKIIETIRKEVEAEKVIPFIGAGFSANLGLPMWNEAVKRMFGKLQKDYRIKVETFSNDNLEAFQYAYWAFGKKECPDAAISDMLVCGKKKLREDFLVEATKSPPVLGDDDFKRKYSQHIALVDRFKKIYTTNWDELIEVTCKKQKKKYKKYYAIIKDHAYGSKYQQIEIESGALDNDAQNDDGMIHIYKYHGCISDATASSLIASSADYHERIAVLNEHPLDQELYWDMREKSIMFIGYSLSDINIKYVINQVLFAAWRPNVTNHQSKFYVISFDYPPPKGSKLLEYRNECVKIIPVYLFHKGHCYHRLIKFLEKEDQSVTFSCGNCSRNCSYKDCVNGKGKKEIKDTLGKMRKKKITRFLEQLLELKKSKSK